MFQDFIPYVMGMGADMAAMVEKCMVVDDTADLSDKTLPSVRQ